MKFRDIIGLTLAILLAIGVALLTRYFLVQEKSDEKVKPEKKIQYNKVLVASKDLFRGQIVATSDLSWQQWPEESLHPNYIKEGTVKLDDLSGAIVKNSLTQGDPVTYNNVIKAGNKSILASLIDPGMRAFSISVSAQSASSGLISPTDYVDVIVGKLASPSGGGDNYGQGRIVVSNVKVLAIDVEMADKHEKPKAAPQVVTLQVTPNQAEKLAAAMKDGALSLSLHSIGASTEPQTSEQDDYGKEDTVTLMRGKDKVEVSINSN